MRRDVARREPAARDTTRRGALAARRRKDPVGAKRRNGRLSLWMRGGARSFERAQRLCSRILLQAEKEPRQSARAESSGVGVEGRGAVTDFEVILSFAKLK